MDEENGRTKTGQTRNPGLALVKGSGRKTRTLSFPLGVVLITPGAEDALQKAGQTAAQLLLRHASGDWGELCPEDVRVNEQGLKSGHRLLSAYSTATGGQVWVITEWDRSVTTVLLPNEY